MAFNLSQSVSGETTTKECSAAVSAVFDNVDLLQMIFGRLDAHDLMHAVQICQATYRLLRGSNPIRKILCLEPNARSPGLLSFNMPTLSNKISTSTEGDRFHFGVRFRIDEESRLVNTFCH